MLAGTYIRNTPALNFNIDAPPTSNPHSQHTRLENPSFSHKTLSQHNKFCDRRTITLIV